MRNLAEALVKSGYQVSSLGCHSDLNDKTKQNGVAVERFPKKARGRSNFSEDRLARRKRTLELDLKNKINLVEISDGGRTVFASIYAFPSSVETFGLVAAEVMAVGRPVVLSNAGADPELIQQRMDGVLNPEDPNPIAEAIVKLLSSPQEAASIGLRTSRKVRSRFSLANCVDETLRKYLSLPAASNSRAS